MPDEASLLKADGISVVFKLPQGELHACEDVTFELNVGESLGIVGESGSGKSVTMLSMMGLLHGSKSKGVLNLYIR